ncbi:alpha/beta fold hydrolase [Cryobacterium sp. MLB-32]|uniref:alpha/beta fold hydrolase n=1 Tax=Cryobacterium sp. MLB-32 TaxID=1529318 RepID=UPI0009DF5B25|nr:alpha/beta hydrolase [Cryobacterium sp. MLB-32]
MDSPGDAPQPSRASTSDAVPVSVLLVHGIRTSSSMWRHQIDVLRGRGHTVAAVDLPGHGSRLGEPFTAVAARRAIDEGVTSLGGRVMLVGLSLGGYWAIDYAATHPERVIGLVASSCSALPRGPLLGGYRALARGIRRLPDRGLLLHRTIARAFLPQQGALDVMAGGVALDVMDAGLRATGRLTPLRSLAAYPGPVWLINGSRDHFRLHEHRFLAACRRGTLIVVPGATHLVSLVQPELFSEHLTAVAQTLTERKCFGDSAA